MSAASPGPQVRHQPSVASDWGLRPRVSSAESGGARPPHLRVSDPRLAVDVYFPRAPDDYWAAGPGLTDRVMGNLCINSSPSNHGPWSSTDLIPTSGGISDIAEIIRHLVILCHTHHNLQCIRQHECRAKGISSQKVREYWTDYTKFAKRNLLTFTILVLWPVGSGEVLMWSSGFALFAGWCYSADVMMIYFKPRHFLVSFPSWSSLYKYLIIKSCWLQLIHWGLTCDENGIIREVRQLSRYWRSTKTREELNGWRILTESSLIYQCLMRGGVQRLEFCLESTLRNAQCWIVERGEWEQ